MDLQERKYLSSLSSSIYKSLDLDVEKQLQSKSKHKHSTHGVTEGGRSCICVTGGISTFFHSMVYSVG